VIRRRQVSPQDALQTLVRVEPSAHLEGDVLTWVDGLTLGEATAELRRAFGPVHTQSQDYLGTAWESPSQRHAPRLELARWLSARSLLVVVARAWGAWGPLGDGTSAPRDALATVAETPGSYPIPEAIAAILLEDGASPTTPAEAIALIAERGYDTLWAQAWSRVS